LSSSSSSSIQEGSIGTGADGSIDLDVEYSDEVKDILTQYTEKKKRRQALVGKITSTKCSKSITVVVEHGKYFPKYNKMIQKRKKIMAHDEEEKGRMGDTVRIVPCRPMSKKKRHALIDIIRRAPV